MRWLSQSLNSTDIVKTVSNHYIAPVVSSRFVHCALKCVATFQSCLHLYNAIIYKIVLEFQEKIFKIGKIIV